MAGAQVQPCAGPKHDLCPYENPRPMWWSGQSLPVTWEEGKPHYAITSWLREVKGSYLAQELRPDLPTKLPQSLYHITLLFK